MPNTTADRQASDRTRVTCDDDATAFARGHPRLSQLPAPTWRCEVIDYAVAELGEHAQCALDIGQPQCEIQITVSARLSAE